MTLSIKSWLKIYSTRKVGIFLKPAINEHHWNWYYQIATTTRVLIGLFEIEHLYLTEKTHQWRSMAASEGGSLWLMNVCRCMAAQFVISQKLNCWTFLFFKVILLSKILNVICRQRAVLICFAWLRQNDLENNNFCKSSFLFIFSIHFSSWIIVWGENNSQSLHLAVSNELTTFLPLILVITLLEQLKFSLRPMSSTNLFLEGFFYTNLFLKRWFFWLLALNIISKGS